jgi:hypothetical protein
LTIHTNQVWKLCWDICGPMRWTWTIEYPSRNDRKIAKKGRKPITEWLLRSEGFRASV